MALNYFHSSHLITFADKRRLLLLNNNDDIKLYNNFNSSGVIMWKWKRIIDELRKLLPWHFTKIADIIYSFLLIPTNINNMMLAGNNYFNLILLLSFFLTTSLFWKDFKVMKLFFISQLKRLSSPSRYFKKYESFFYKFG